VSEDLKPCPLCGGQFRTAQEPEDNSSAAGLFYVFHRRLTKAERHCPIEISSRFDTPSEAIFACNRRAIAPTPPASKGEVLSYDNPIGVAGEAYMRSVGMGTSFNLSGTFRWQELWDAMIAAALASDAGREGGG
jgi:hypothetical protein